MYGVPPVPHQQRPGGQAPPPPPAQGANAPPPPPQQTGVTFQIQPMAPAPAHPTQQRLQPVQQSGSRPSPPLPLPLPQQQPQYAPKARQSAQVPAQRQSALRGGAPQRGSGSNSGGPTVRYPKASSSDHLNFKDLYELPLTDKIAQLPKMDGSRWNNAIMNQLDNADVTEILSYLCDIDPTQKPRCVDGASSRAKYLQGLVDEYGRQAQDSELVMYNPRNIIDLVRAERLYEQSTLQSLLCYQSSDGSFCVSNGTEHRFLPRTMSPWDARVHWDFVQRRPYLTSGVESTWVEDFVTVPPAPTYSELPGRLASPSSRQGLLASEKAKLGGSTDSLDGTPVKPESVEPLPIGNSAAPPRDPSPTPSRMSMMSLDGAEAGEEEEFLPKMPYAVVGYIPRHDDSAGPDVPVLLSTTDPNKVAVLPANPMKDFEVRFSRPNKKWLLSSPSMNLCKYVDACFEENTAIPPESAAAKKRRVLAPEFSESQWSTEGQGGNLESQDLGISSPGRKNQEPSVGLDGKQSERPDVPEVPDFEDKAEEAEQKVATKNT